MPPTGGLWASQALRLLSKNVAAGTKMIRSKVAAAVSRPLGAAELQPVAVRNGARQPIHPAAWLRQQKRGARWYNTAGSYVNAAVRRYISTGAKNSAPHFVRSSFPSSQTSRAVAQLAGRAPFASTLRPNLTGGALPRTAGGDAAPGMGRAGGARYFSHTPTAPAQVVQNVSQAMRAFWISGQRAVYDGEEAGKPRYRAVNTAQEEARLRLERMPRNAPGSFIDFRINPTVTALSPLGITFPNVTEEGFGLAAKPAMGASTLNTEGFLGVLSGDFARVLKDLAAVMTDLKKIAILGDLPISLEKGGTVLRIRFPGVDAGTVESLCDDVGVSRGIVGQDPGFDASAGVAVALKFPYAPDEARARTITSPGGSMRSHDSSLSDLDEDAVLEEGFFFESSEENPWLAPGDHEGYESMSPPLYSNSGEHCSEDFEGLEGVYRFLEECNAARGNFGRGVQG
jgi:hypothetical protein